MSSMTIHVVQAGETVGSIAASYGVDPARLAADNAVPPSGALAVGQTLVVRFPRQVHAVRAGETLASIAEAYGTTVRRLWQNNWPLGGQTDLRPGENLVISYFDEPLDSAVFNGYAYPYIEQSLLERTLPYLTQLAPFTYGITAEGDMIAALGMRYGSDEAVAFAVEVHKTLALAAYGASVEMAEERGAFPLYDAARELDNPMIARIREADPALYERMVKSGRRNIAMLTIAPTGTTSLMSQTTSGIEPVFRPVYKRRRKINPSDHNVKVAFVDDTGERFEEFYVFHHNFVECVNGRDTSTLATISDAELEKLVAASPYHKATANDIDWVAKVKMQGAIQKWVDHSISVTVNLPNEVSEELVADVYRTAWECGCKGVTVYRDGCREGVLLDKKQKKKGGDKGAADGSLKRPKSLPADIVRFKNGQEEWIAFVGLMDGRPYEIFTGKLEEDALYIPRKITKGNIIKVREADGKKRYDFQYTDRYGYTNTVGGISRLFDEEFWNYAKLISGVLRHGMPIDNVVSLIESLHLNSETINTWKNGVERALKQYIVDGTKSKEKCPSCGQETLVYQNGCLTCVSCGYSKCG